MNQLEFFVASTECTRADVKRYLRQMRELDELMEHSTNCMRYITEQRLQYVAAHPDLWEAHLGEGELAGDAYGGGLGMSARQRQQRSGAAGRNAGGRAAAAHSGSSSVVANAEDILKHSIPSSVRCGVSSPAVDQLTGLSQEDLQNAYVYHRTRVQRYALEREQVASELVERATELKSSLAARLAQFEHSVSEEQRP